MVDPYINDTSTEFAIQLHRTLQTCRQGLLEIFPKPTADSIVANTVIKFASKTTLSVLQSIDDSVRDCPASEGEHILQDMLDTYQRALRACFEKNARNLTIRVTERPHGDQS